MWRRGVGAVRHQRSALRLAALHIWVALLPCLHLGLLFLRLLLLLACSTLLLHLPAGAQKKPGGHHRALVTPHSQPVTHDVPGLHESTVHPWLLLLLLLGVALRLST